MTRLSATALAPLALTMCLATPALAFDPAAMTDAERQAFRSEVRAFLLENPEVIMEAVAALEESRMADAAAKDIEVLRANKDALENDANSWVGGNPEGDITIVEFLDYRCGYCRKAWSEVEELVKSDGNIRFIVKEFPILGEQSMLASRFAIAVRMVAGDDAYKSDHDALINPRGDTTPESLERIASDMGLDAKAVMAKMDAAEVTAIIDANHQLGSTLEINGTPSFVIGETMVRGYVPLDGMRQIVEGVRAE